MFGKMLTVQCLKCKDVSCSFLGGCSGQAEGWEDDVRLDNRGAGCLNYA